MAASCAITADITAEKVGVFHKVGSFSAADTNAVSVLLTDDVEAADAVASFAGVTS